MTNPVINRFTTPQQQIYNMNDRVLTLDDVLMKAILQFSILLPIAAAVYMFAPVASIGALMMMSMFATLILGIGIAFMKSPGPIPVMIYAVLEGIFVGAISRNYERFFDGIVMTAVTATGITALAIIVGTKMGFLRTSPRARRIFFFALLGYMAFSLVAIFAHLLGFPILTLGSPFAIAVSIFGTFMAAFAFVTDIENIQYAVQNRVPEKNSWALSYGLVVGLVWLYLEILRLIANISSITR